MRNSQAIQLRCSDLPEETQQVAAPELVNALLGVTAAQHGVRDHRKVADIAHATSQGGSAVEVGAERNVILPHHLDGFVHYCYPVVDRHHDRVRYTSTRHGELRRDQLVYFIDRLAFYPIRNAGGIEECFASLRRQPLVLFGIAELATNLETNDAALCRQLLKQGIRHVSG